LHGFFVAQGEVGTIQALIGAVFFAISGLVVVAVGQMGLAQIATAENTNATAENTRLMLAFLQSGGNHKLPISTPVHTRSNSVSTGQVQGTTFSAKEIGSRVKKFKGFEILKAKDGVSVDGEQFENLLVAEKWISEQLKK
jgi:hypothetical protein